MFDLLSMAVSRIKVGVAIKRPSIQVPRSNLIVACLTKLVDLGYILSFKIVNERLIIVYLKYFENKPVIRQIKRMSTPGRRLHCSYRRFRNNNVQGFLLISTSKGVMTDQECLFYKVGGEPLLIVA